MISEKLTKSYQICHFLTDIDYTMIQTGYNHAASIYNKASSTIQGGVTYILTVG